MHPLKPEICSGIAGVRARVFINRVVDGKESFIEIPTRAETVWLFPGSDCGVLLFRGTSRVIDETLDDVTHLMAEWELLQAEPETLDFYHQKFLKTVAPVAGGTDSNHPCPPPHHLHPILNRLLLHLNRLSLLRFLRMPKNCWQGANEAIAKVEAQADAAFAKLGMTREQAMAKVCATAQSRHGANPGRIRKDDRGCPPAGRRRFQKAGDDARRRRPKKYLTPQPAPKDTRQEITKLTDALQGVRRNCNNPAPIMQEAAAKVVPTLIRLHWTSARSLPG